MSIENILQQVDNEIATLTKARAALTGLGSGKRIVKGKRVISSIARKRMAKAQRARWAKVRSLKRSKR
jgi:hypothetical protein